MTPREIQLLDAIERMTTDRGYPPAMRELAGELGVSLTRVKQLADACQRQGTLTRAPRVARSFRVLRPLPSSGRPRRV